MNKATLVFVCNDQDAIITAKKTFVEFLGMRMIEDVCIDSPILRLQTSVDSYDMNKLSEHIPDHMTVLVVTSDETIDIMSQKYTYVQMA